MKTTIDLPPPLLKKARKYAETHNLTLKALIEMGLQQILSNQSPEGVKFKLVDKSVSGEGLQGGLDWNDWTTIRQMA